MAAIKKPTADKATGKKTATKKAAVIRTAAKNAAEQPVKKSKIALFREKHPNGVIEIIDMEAILE